MIALRALDLFSGAAGGWSLGLARAGIPTIAACEASSWRREVYRWNHPGIPIYDDVRELTAERLRADLGRLPTLVVGSPPCQDASCANHSGRGIDGPRTGLFTEALRVIRECRPRWACLENVAGLRTRGADRVLAELEAAGYAAWPLVVGAVHAGAPHRRMRVWIVAADAERVDLRQLGQRLAGGWPDALCARRHAVDSLSGPAHVADPNGSRCGDAAPQEADRSAACLLASRDRAAAFADAGGQRQRGRGLAQLSGLESTSGHEPLGPRADRIELGPHIGGDADGARLALDLRAANDDEEPAALGVEWLDAWSHWSGGCARHLRVAHELSARLARRGHAVDVDAATGSATARKVLERAIAAYGDAVLPDIAELIGRTILAVDACANSADSSDRPERAA